MPQCSIWALRSDVRGRHQSSFNIPSRNRPNSLRTSATILLAMQQHASKCARNPYYCRDGPPSPRALTKSQRSWPLRGMQRRKDATSTPRPISPPPQPPREGSLVWRGHQAKDEERDRGPAMDQKSWHGGHHSREPTAHQSYKWWGKRPRDSYSHRAFIGALLWSPTS